MPTKEARRPADPFTVRRGARDVLLGVPEPEPGEPGDDGGEWMALADAAAAFGVSQAEVRRWINAGEVTWQGTKKAPEVYVLPADEEGGEDAG